jgi:hypothetical protein
MRFLLKFLAGFAFSLIFAEFLFRGGILFNVSWVKNPDWYADWTSDDNYWKLRHLWIQKVTPQSKELIDPMLGWVTPRSPGNPLGAITDIPYRIDVNEPTVLIVGDSFIHGSTEMKDRIPQRVSKELEPLKAHNLGVLGYGWDQVFLRAQQSKNTFKKPFIVAGLFTAGLDRSVLSFRTGPKPYFEKDGEGLILKGIPIPEDSEGWVKDHPPQIPSYLWAATTRIYQKMRAKNSLEVEGKELEKRQINEALLKAWVTQFKNEKTPLLFVLFYNKEELPYQGWREKFVKTQLDNLQAQYIDSKELLLEQSKIAAVKPESFYSKDGHLNEKGNEIVAIAIATRIKSFWRGWREVAETKGPQN